jgi:hypothetical protein
MVRKFGVAAATAVLLLTAACGGSGGGRPSVGDIQKELTKNGGGDSFGLGDKFTGDTAKCFAKAIHDSDLSDKAVKALIDQDKDFKPSSSDEKAIGSITTEFSKCVPTP